MSRLPQNAIQPLAPDLLQPILLPWAQAILRAIAILAALGYAYAVPQALTLTTYALFLLGGTIFMACSAMLGLWTILRGGQAIVTGLLLISDLTGWLTLLLNDPSNAAPSLALWPVVMMLQAMILPWRWWRWSLGLSLTGATAILALRQFWLHIPLNFTGQSLLLMDIMSAAPIAIFSYYLGLMHERTARITEPDPLTGLGNRWTFYEAAKYLLPYHQRNLTPMMVLYAEVEILSQQKKQTSSMVVDLVVKQFASILDRRLRASDVASRYSRCSFALLLADISSREAEKIAFEVQQEFHQWAKNKNYPAFAHLGLAVVPVRPIALDQILININAALFRAKQYKRGVSGAVFADPEQTLGA